MDERNAWKRCPYTRQQAAMPFYMTYPMMNQWNFGSWEEEDAAMRDLEYLIQMYPRQARKYQEKIIRMLDTMDYQGSVIYDEYPDRLALSRIADHIFDMVRAEEEHEMNMQVMPPVNDGMMEEEAGELRQSGEQTMQQSEAAMQPAMRSEREWENIRELLLILLYYEIFRRRRGMYSGRAGFYNGMGGMLGMPQNMPGMQGSMPGNMVGWQGIPDMQGMPGTQGSFGSMNWSQMNPGTWWNMNNRANFPGNQSTDEQMGDNNFHINDF